MTLAELYATERERIFTIARRHGVTSVKVFGPFARDEAPPASDLDLLIEAGLETSPSTKEFRSSRRNSRSCWR
jgi:predicted nucleotidyltransferase